MNRHPINFANAFDVTTKILPFL